MATKYRNHKMYELKYISITLEHSVKVIIP